MRGLAWVSLGLREMEKVCWLGGRACQIVEGMGEALRQRYQRRKWSRSKWWCYWEVGVESVLPVTLILL